MRREDRIFPYQSTDLTGQKALVLAPHPDDETLGCGGSLALHTNAGDPVKVVFLTNGAMGDSTGKFTKTEYSELRRKEAKQACAFLGVYDIEFWGYEDRGLSGSRNALVKLIRLFEEYRPELVYIPSPVELHPDHRAAAFLAQDAVKSRPLNFKAAFYEISQPVIPNTLVDITSVLDTKKQAVNAYSSQLSELPYDEICLSLNRYRSLTLSEKTTHAEGFSIWDSSDLREFGVLSLPFLDFSRYMPARAAAGPLVSVIVRTKDRPGLLLNALKSITEQTYANLEIVVVNDGGKTVKNLIEKTAGGIPYIYIEHETCKGRAAAANSGLTAARGVYINFLDDDDILYPNHLEYLVNHIQTAGAGVAYSTVKSVYFSGPPENPENIVKEEMIFDLDFDPDRLLFANYIPIMSALIERDRLTEADRFDETLDLFEDWDFWIKLSRRFPFSHLDKTTAEYRFYGVQQIGTAHREKYRYAEAQAAMFERIRPLLNGPVWVNFLQNDLEHREAMHEKETMLADLKSKLDEETEKTRQMADALNHLTRRFEKVDMYLNYYQTELKKKEAEIDEILSSKGWRALTLFRKIKIKLKRRITGE